MPIGKDEGAAACDHHLAGRRHVEERPLTAIVPSDLSRLELQQHWRSIAEVERNVVMDGFARPARDVDRSPLTVDIVAVDGAVSLTILRRVVRRV